MSCIYNLALKVIQNPVEFTVLKKKHTDTLTKIGQTINHFQHYCSVPYRTKSIGKVSIYLAVVFWQSVKDWRMSIYPSTTFLLIFYRFAVYSEKILTLGHFNLVTKWAHSCTLSPLVIVLCSWSQIPISCLCVEHNMLPSEQRKTFFEWPAREPGQRWDWASGQAAKTEPLLPFSFPSVFRKGCVIKA